MSVIHWSSISGLLTSWKTPWIVPNSVLKKRLDLLRLFLATDSAPRERNEDVPDHNPSQTTNRQSLFADVRGEVVLSQATREERSLERTNISASGPFLRLIMMLKKKLLFFQTKNGKQKDFFLDCSRSNPVLRRTLRHFTEANRNLHYR